MFIYEQLPIAVAQRESRLIIAKGGSLKSVHGGVSIGSLVVLEGDKILGIITVREYAPAIVLMARSSKTMAVRDVMTTPVIYLLPDQTSEECMALMTLQHYICGDRG